MRQSDRRKLLYFLVFLFIIAGGSVAFYAQGYRIDPGTLGVRKIGAIYVRSYPASADMYLDGQPIEKKRSYFQKNFWFLQGGTLINNLFPKEYKLELKLEDYEDWKQTLEVKPAIVTEVKYAVMIPEKRSEILSGTVSDFWLLGDSIIVKDVSSTLRYGNATLPGTNVLQVEENSGRVLTTDKVGALFVFDSRNNRFQNLSSAIRTAGLANKDFKIILLDENGEDVLLGGLRELYLLNIPSSRFAEIAHMDATSTKEIANFDTSPAYVAWSEYDRSKDSSALIVYNKGARTRFEYPFPFSGKTTQIDLQNERLGLLQSDGAFYFGAPLTSGGMEKVASDALQFAFMDNLAKIAVREKRALEVFPLRNTDEEKYVRFELPQASTIRNMLWHQDGRHLFVSYDNRTLFLDLDDSRLEHFTRIAGPEVAYRRDGNQLYSHESSSLFVTALPE